MSGSRHCVIGFHLGTSTPEISIFNEESNQRSVSQHFRLFSLFLWERLTFSGAGGAKSVNCWYFGSIGRDSLFDITETLAHRFPKMVSVSKTQFCGYKLWFVFKHIDFGVIDFENLGFEMSNDNGLVLLCWFILYAEVRPFMGSSFVLVVTSSVSILIGYVCSI